METFIAETYENNLLFFFFKVKSKEQKLQGLKVSFHDGGGGMGADPWCELIKG